MTSRVEEVARRWGLAIGEPYPGVWNLVHRVTLPDGGHGVLKVAASPAVDLAREAAALRAWDGDGAVRLLRAAPDALLLERLDPGTTLVDLVARDDDAATEILGAVGQRLHRASPPRDDLAGLPTLASRARAFDEYQERHGDGGGPVLDGLVGRAAAVFATLQRNGSDVEVVLHGDLHHTNVLHDAGRGWLAIDPHGLVGDPAYEFAALLYNPLHLDRTPAEAARTVERLPRRLAVLAEVTGIDRDRLAAWGFVQAVLSEVWRDEDGAAGAALPFGVALDVALALAPLT